MRGPAPKYIGCGISALCLLAVIGGLSIKGLYVHEEVYGVLDFKWQMGIREIYTRANHYDGDELTGFWRRTESRVNIWTSEEVTRHYGGLPMRHSLIAALTCFCIGLLANVTQCASFLSELCGRQVRTARNAALATGGAMLLFYQIGFLCALVGPRDFISSTLPEDHRGTPGPSIVLFVAAWFGSIITVGLAYIWKDAAAPPAKLDAEAAEVEVAVPQSVAVGDTTGNSQVYTDGASHVSV
jgi:hypothetical protein